MKKKLKGNGLWESSRMMLPEHKEQLIDHTTRLTYKTRPVLDEQKLQDISAMIAESLSSGMEITLVKFNQIKDREFTGRVLQVDQHQRKVKISDDVFEYFWLYFHEIVDAKPASHKEDF